MGATNADIKLSEDHVESIDSGEGSPYYTEAAAERGALLIHEENQLSLFQSAKLHWRAVLVCSVSYAGAFLIGFDQVAATGASTMPAFLLYFGDIGPTGPYLPSVWVSLWGSIASLAQAVGAVLVGLVLDRFGRKWPACALSALTMIGTGVLYQCNSRGVFLLGRIINSIAIGGIGTIVGTYISEVAPVRLRSVMQQGLLIFGLATLALGLGIVLAFVPDVRESAFRTVFALQWIVGVIGLVVFAWAPESPAFLITKGRLEQAHKAMGRIYGKDNQVMERLSFYTKEIRLEQEIAKNTSAGSYWDCFGSVERKRTLTVIFIYMANNWAGAPFLANGIYFLIIAGMAATSAFEIGMSGFYISIAIILLSWFVEGKFRRRDAFLVGCIICAVFMLVIGCLYYAPGSGTLWGIAVLMNVLIGLQSSLLQGMGLPIAIELSSYRLRAKTLALGYFFQVVSSWLVGFVTPYMFNVDSGNLGARTGFIFAALSALLLVGGYFWVPETGGLTTEEIDKAYIDKIAPRHFQNISRNVEANTDAQTEQAV